jgi:hypothetical protein
MATERGLDDNMWRADGVRSIVIRKTVVPAEAGTHAEYAGRRLPKIDRLMA